MQTNLPEIIRLRYAHEQLEQACVALAKLNGDLSGRHDDHGHVVLYHFEQIAKIRVSLKEAIKALGFEPSPVESKPCESEQRTPESGFMTDFMRALK